MDEYLRLHYNAVCPEAELHVIVPVLTLPEFSLLTGRCDYTTTLGCVPTLTNSSSAVWAFVLVISHLTSSHLIITIDFSILFVVA